MVLQWLAALGDRTLAGWLITLGYLLAAGAGALVVVRARRCGSSVTAQVWAGIVVTLVALGINKQLDLQTLVIRSGRAATANGLETIRRPLQFWFTVLVLVGTVAAIAALAVRLRSHIGSLWPELAGMCLLISFVVMRVASFSHVETIARIEQATGRVHVLELMSLLLVIAAAGRQLHQLTPVAPWVGPDTD